MSVTTAAGTAGSASKNARAIVILNGQTVPVRWTPDAQFCWACIGWHVDAIGWWNPDEQLFFRRQFDAIEYGRRLGIPYTVGRTVVEV